MNNLYLKRTTILLFFFLGAFIVPASALDLKLPGVSAGGDGGFDLAGGKTELVERFFESSNNYLEALALLNKALGKNIEAAQIEKAIEYANDPGISESDRMKKKRASFKARHRRNIKKGKMSAAYWANRVKW